MSNFTVNFKTGFFSNAAFEPCIKLAFFSNAAFEPCMISKVLLILNKLSSALCYII